MAVDINPYAIRNAKHNARKLSIKNVSFKVSDLFSKVSEKYDIIIFNPPFSNYKPRDLTDRMFWDANNKTKERFFREAKAHLNPDGRIYLAWADFSDLDVDLPFRLANKEGYQIKKIAEKRVDIKRFFVLEIMRKP